MPKKKKTVTRTLLSKKTYDVLVSGKENRPERVLIPVGENPISEADLARLQASEYFERLLKLGRVSVIEKVEADEPAGEPVEESNEG